MCHAIPGQILEIKDVPNRLARVDVAGVRRTSVGRLFDAVAALSGIRYDVTYEGQAAMELEHEGLRVLVPERLPPNDGGIAFGQAVVAAAREEG